jgi:hypothetical protein
MHWLGKALQTVLCASRDVVIDVVDLVESIRKITGKHLDAMQLRYYVHQRFCRDNTKSLLYFRERRCQGQNVWSMHVQVNKLQIISAFAKHSDENINDELPDDEIVECTSCYQSCLGTGTRTERLLQHLAVEHKRTEACVQKLMQGVCVDAKTPLETIGIDVAVLARLQKEEEAAVRLHKHNTHYDNEIKPLKDVLAFLRAIQTILRTKLDTPLCLPVCSAPRHKDIYNQLRQKYPVVFGFTKPIFDPHGLSVLLQAYQKEIMRLETDRRNGMPLIPAKMDVVIPKEEDAAQRSRLLES